MVMVKNGLIIGLILSYTVILRFMSKKCTNYLLKVLTLKLMGSILAPLVDQCPNVILLSVRPCLRTLFLALSDQIQKFVS